MRVRELLESRMRSVITTAPSTAIMEAMELLIVNQISALPVVDDTGSLVGIISDKDIFKRIFTEPAHFQQTQVRDLMTTDLIIGVPDDEIPYIAGVMTTNRIRHVPIMEGDRLVGLISVGDIVKTQMEDAQIENRYLWQYINGTYPG
ncbi:MAG: CBS domain-containing protein [Candidatus Zixiibacteriota bacterium]